MQISKGMIEVGGWGLAFWAAYHVLKQPSLEKQCRMAALAAKVHDPLNRDPEDKKLVIRDIERNVNMTDAPPDLIRGCEYDVCHMSRPKWTPDTISNLTVYIPRDRACEAQGKADRKDS